MVYISMQVDISIIPYRFRICSNLSYPPMGDMVAISGRSTLLEGAVSIPCKILGAKRSIQLHSHCNAVPGCATAMPTCNRCLGYWWLYISGLCAFLLFTKRERAYFLHTPASCQHRPCHWCDSTVDTNLEHYQGTCMTSMCVYTFPQVGHHLRTQGPILTVYIAPILYTLMIIISLHHRAVI